MPSATWVIECDWDNNGVFTDTSEDLTANVLEAEWNYGRDYASQLTGRSVAGWIGTSISLAAGVISA